MAIDLSKIPRLEVEDGGVHFRYLVFRLTVEDQEGVLVRALNFQPYREELDQSIINWAWQSLEDTGLDESGATLQVGGGGSLAIDPYYETATLFGASSEYGPEEERGTVARLFQEAFPDYDCAQFDTKELVKTGVLRRLPLRELKSHQFRQLNVLEPLGSGDRQAGYVAPELVDNPRLVDPRCDIYSVIPLVDFREMLDRE